MNALARRLWLNIGLLGIASLLIVLTWSISGPEPVKTSALLDLPPAQIQRINVERLNQEPLVFELRGEGWWMTMPATGLANPVLLAQILHFPQVHCPLSYSATGLDLARLGLDPPQLRLRLNGQEVHFGMTAPTDGQRYLRIGKMIYLCPDTLYPLLTSGAGSFIAPPVETLLFQNGSDK